jgi:hypothetical protein
MIAGSGEEVGWQMKRERARSKRGRPPKFGRPARVVAVTLPEETIRDLRRVHADLGWAIVRLLERGATKAQPKNNGTPRSATRPPSGADSALVNIANGRSLIAVNRKVFKKLPGINVIPLHGDQAFLALDRDASVADLELAVVDRMEGVAVSARERTALAELRGHLRRWRRDPTLRCLTRSIIVVQRAR